MKKIIFILLLVATGFAADKIITEAVIVQTVNALPTKIEALDKKNYSGSITDILGDRLKDVNAVYIEQVKVELQAKALLEKQGVDISKGNAVMTIITTNKARQEIDRKKDNVEFIKAIEEMLSDPNVLPDVNDPNYFGEMKLITEIKQSCYEMVADNI